MFNNYTSPRFVKYCRRCKSRNTTYIITLFTYFNYNRLIKYFSTFHHFHDDGGVW